MLTSAAVNKTARRLVVAVAFALTLVMVHPIYGQAKRLRQFDLSGKVAIGFKAVRLRDGKVLADHRSERTMVPASVQKVVTSAVALEALGGDYRFQTRLGLFENKLIVIGDGDPLTGEPRVAEQTGSTIYAVFDRWAKRLVDKGVTEVSALVLDDTIIRERRHPDWPKSQYSRWYCAPAAGLNFNDNCIDVNFDMTSARPKLVVSPSSDYIDVVNRIARASSGRNIWNMTQTPDCSELTFTGRAVREGVEPVSSAVDSPPMLFGRVLADRLKRAGVTLAGPIERMRVRRQDGEVPPQIEIVATEGSTLAETLKQMNKRSMTFMAECLLLRSDAALGGDGSYESAARTAAKLLTEHYGLVPDQFVLSDGGGLSRVNGLSTGSVCTILARLAAGPNAAVFLASLPVSGVDGTLEKRLRNQAGRVAAKTGTLSGARTLAGYVLDADGRPVIAFGVFANSIRMSVGEVKAAMDDFVEELIVQADAQAAP